MERIKCPECGTEVVVTNNEKKCPNCGCPSKYFIVSQEEGELSKMEEEKERSLSQLCRNGIKKRTIIWAFIIGIIIFVLAISFCLTPKKPSQIGDFKEGLATAILNGKYGYINQEGKETIPCIYDSVCDFKDGYGKIQKDKLWGMVNIEGKEVFPIKYDSIQDFHEHIAIASAGGKFVLLKDNGSIVDVCCETTDNYQFNFKNNYLKVIRDGKIGFVDKQGSEVVPFIFDDAKDYGGWNLVYVKKENKWGIYNCSDEAKTMITPFCFDDIEYVEHSSSRHIVKKDGKYGILFLSDFTKKPLQYDELHFEYPIIAFSITGYNDRFTICNEGNYFIKTVGYNNERYYALNDYSFVGTLYDTFIAVGKGEKIGFLKYPSFEEIVPCIYDNALENKGVEIIVEKDGLWGVLDYNGRPMLPFKYKEIGYKKYNGIRNVLEAGDSYWKYLNSDGQVICDMPFEYADCLDNFGKYGGARVKIHGKWNYLLYKGASNFTLMDDEGFDECSQFDKIMRVAKDGRTYYIDENNEEVFPKTTNKLLEMYSFSEGLSLAYFSGDKYGYINTEGRRVLSLYSYAKSFHNGRAIVGIHYIDKDGKIVGEYHNPNAKPDPFLESFVSFDPEKERMANELKNRLYTRQYINKTVRYLTNGMP